MNELFRALQGMGAAIERAREPKPTFTVRSWHHACQSQASIARRAGYTVRPSARGWEVWATDDDFGELVIQAGGDRHG